MPTATLSIVFLEGKIDSGLDHWIMEWVWDNNASAPLPAPLPVWEPYVAEVNGTMLVIDHANNVGLESFDALHIIDHAVFWGREDGDSIAIYATQPIVDVQLINFSDDWDDSSDEFIFTLEDSHPIADIVHPGEGILIENYISIGTMPHTGISFYDSSRTRHYFAINHDNSDSPHVFLLWNITEQMQGE